MENTTLNILNISAKAGGWVHRGTLRQWEYKCQGYTVSSNIPPALPRFSDKETFEPPADNCTFWFNLKHNNDVIIGFDWNAKNPNIVKTVGGSWQISTPINLSYVTSQKQLAEFFASSIAIQKQRKAPTPTVFTKVMKFLTKEII